MEIFIVKTNRCEYMEISAVVLLSVSALLEEYTVSGIEAWKFPHPFVLAQFIYK